MLEGLTLVETDGEPFVLDLVLAERLGFERPRDIRPLIERHVDEIRRYGSLRCRAANPGPQGGRPGTEYLLNENQALLVALLSRAPKAPDVREAVLAVFAAWRNGKLVPADPQALGLPNFEDPAEAAEAWARQVRARRAVEAKVAELAPKAAFHDEHMAADGLYTMAQAAAALAGKSDRWLFERLRGAGWFDRREGTGGNVPRQWVKDAGFVVVKLVAIMGGKRVAAQSFLTPKGFHALRLAMRDGELFLAGVDKLRLSPPSPEGRPT